MTEAGGLPVRTGTECPKHIQEHFRGRSHQSKSSISLLLGSIDEPSAPPPIGRSPTPSCPGRQAYPRRSLSDLARSPAVAPRHRMRAPHGRIRGKESCGRASTAPSCGCLLYRSRAIGNLVHSVPMSSRQGGRHSTIVRYRGATSHSTRTWSRTASGTRSSHHRRTRATSSSGRPYEAPWQVFQPSQRTSSTAATRRPQSQTWQ